MPNKIKDRVVANMYTSADRSSLVTVQLAFANDNVDDNAKANTSNINTTSYVRAPSGNAQKV